MNDVRDQGWISYHLSPSLQNNIQKIDNTCKAIAKIMNHRTFSQWYKEYYFSSRPSLVYTHCRFITEWNNGMLCYITILINNKSYVTETSNCVLS